jgi:two-component SAPR family response regulator
LRVDLKKTFLKTSEARYFLENNPVDLLFLDINMPAASGIDFYKTLPQETLVIFTTAYKEYAVESYESEPSIIC